MQRLILFGTLFLGFIFISSSFAITIIQDPPGGGVYVNSYDDSAISVAVAALSNVYVTEGYPILNHPPSP
jgi:hypothetical protein